MRYFPSAARQRATAACAGLVALAALVMPLAHADDESDLEKQKDEVKGQISEATSDLHEASKAVAQAVTRVEQAEARLATARRTLTDVRTRLVAAQERDATLQGELEAAELELTQATDALAAGTAAVEAQRAQARRTLVSNYTQGDARLRAIGSFLESGSLQEYSSRRLGEQVITNAQANTFADLKEVEAQLATEQERVEKATAAVEVKRTEAADHLEEVQGLFAEASAAEKSVAGLVVEARAARKQAWLARSADRKTLQALKKRERRINDRLLELARSQRNQKGFTGRSDGYLSYPASGPVTSPYGYRTHPIYGYYSLHNGTDFGTGCGAPLRASAGGTVIDTYYDSVYGNRVFLSIGKVNGESLVLIYNHLERDVVSEGQQLERGTVLGYSGTTGWSTGCHLHFTVMENGVAVDPMKYL